MTIYYCISVSLLQGVVGPPGRDGRNGTEGRKGLPGDPVCGLMLCENIIISLIIG